LIKHAKERVAIEIKPTGALEPLKADAAKLRSYLRRKDTGITFGVLLFRSRRPIPNVLYDAMKQDRLAIVRVAR
jgi:hypothetical protein